MSHDHPKEDKYSETDTDTIIGDKIMFDGYTSVKDKNASFTDQPKLGLVKPFGDRERVTVDGVLLAESLPDTNPKSVFGMKKPALHLVPQTFLVMVSKVMMLGAKKYGAYNWRTNSVAASVYVGAAMRHIASWWDGEDLDPESGAPHLAHAAACCAIIIDAWATGNLIDDRPPVGAAARLIQEHTVND